MNRSDQQGFEGDLPPVVGGSVDEYVATENGGFSGDVTLTRRAAKPADNL